MTRPNSPIADRVVLAPPERRETVLNVIRSARERLILSLFRCNDSTILDELAEAVRRNVQVKVLLTRRARGGKKRLKKLWKLLEAMGAQVHRYDDAVVKYHAKYIVADQGPAVIASLNFNRKCFENTCDFLVMTHDPEVLDGLVKLFEGDCRASEGFPLDLSERLIVGPERARQQFVALIQQARRSIRIIDPKISDPEMLALLAAQQADGVGVEVLREAAVGSLISHGKMLLIDETVAVLGSISLATLSLDFRREVAIVVRDATCVNELHQFFQGLSLATSSAGPLDVLEAQA